MPRRLAPWLILATLGTAGGIATVALTSGQPPATPPPSTRPATPPPVRSAPTIQQTSASAPVVAAQGVDPNRYSLFGKQMLLTAQRGAEWLHRMHKPDGRFVSGWVPALNVPLDSDHFLRQASAAFALARAARFTGDERYAARARQATLALMAETAADPADPDVRHTVYPSIAVNRLGAAGHLLMTIHELPGPASDLLDQGEQLAAFIRKQQRPDGALAFADQPDDEGADHHPGAALYGVMLSQRHRPAAWKTDLVRQALAHSRAAWQARPSLAFVPYQAAAFAEAFLLTKEPAFAEFVFAMADRVCQLQYEQIDPRHPNYRGGFQSLVHGKPVASAPRVDAAGCTEALADACRVARQLPDPPRHERYKAALARGLAFVASLQYTEDNSQHFSPAYRPVLLGGFHGSHQDGELRLESTQHAVSALVQYLAHVADR